jgi:hypothetical protein
MDITENEYADFWSETMGGGWEFDSCWIDMNYSEGADWETPGRFTIIGEDPENEGKTISKELGIEDLLKAYQFCLDKGYGHCGGEYDWQDQDMCTSSGILQVAVYGDILYG